MEVILPIIVLPVLVGALIYVWWEHDQQKEKEKEYSRQISAMKIQHKEEAQQRRKEKDEKEKREADRVALLQLAMKERDKRAAEKKKSRKAEEAKEKEDQKAELVDRMAQLELECQKVLLRVEELATMTNIFLSESASLSYSKSMKTLDNAFFSIIRLSLSRNELLGEIESSVMMEIEGDELLESSYSALIDRHNEFDEIFSSVAQNLRRGYERLINMGISDPKTRGIVHICITALYQQQEFFFLGDERIELASPKSEQVSSILDDNLLDCLIAQGYWLYIKQNLKEALNDRAAYLPNSNLIDYHIRQAEESLNLAFRRFGTDKLVVGLLNQINLHLSTKNKTAREVSYLWNQIEQGNIADIPERPSNSNPISTVHQGIAFEERCLRLLEARGFSVRQTSSTNDGGVDLELIDETPLTGGKIVVQCKDWDTSVGVPVVRELLGIVVADGTINKGIVITSGRFTKQAEEFAQGTLIDLIDGDALAALESEYLG